MIVAKFWISGIRRGQLDYADAYTPRDAAKKAVKLAKRGFEVKVTKGDGKKAWMTCTPDRNRPAKPQGKKLWPDEVATVRCVVPPSTRKQLKDRKANR